MGEHYTPLWLAEEVIGRLPEISGRVLDPSVGGGVFALALAKRLSREDRDWKDFQFVGLERNPWSVFGAAANWAIANRHLGGPADRPIPIACFDPLAYAAFDLEHSAASSRSLGLAPGSQSLFDNQSNSPADGDLAADGLNSADPGGSRSLGLAPGSQAHFDNQSNPTATGDLTAEGAKSAIPGASPRLRESDPPLRGESFGQFDAIVGNPPWVLWDNLAAADLERIKLLARHYGLFVEKGMNSILGGGKKDLAMLFTLVVADRYLKLGGTLAFVMPQSVFKATKSGRGFRRWRLPDGTPLKVVSVDDLSALQPFPTATTKTTILVLKKGEETSYPVDYFVWSAKPCGRKEKLAAAPGDPDDPLSAWQCKATTGEQSATIDGVLGKCDYVAHLGVNTGGANGVYWFERLNDSDGQIGRHRQSSVDTASTMAARSASEGRSPKDSRKTQTSLGLRPSLALAFGKLNPGRAAINPDFCPERQTWLMRNLAERGKRKVASRSVEIESDYLYPIVLGNDVKPWIARPSAWILLVQDPDRRRGIEREQLQATAPLSLGYLEQHETMLRERAAFRRYFQRETGGRTADVAPFYSMFDVGPYVRSKFKVVWNRMGHRLGAAVIGELEGKPIQCQETHAYFPVECATAAYFLAALLNSRMAQAAMNATAPVGGKSFATPGAIHRLHLPKFDENQSVHIQLAKLGLQASREAAEHGQPIAETTGAMERAAACIWKVAPSTRDLV